MNKLLAKFRGAYKSWTIWFNVIALGASFPGISLFPGFVQWFFFLVAVGNVILRFKTDKDLAAK